MGTNTSPGPIAQALTELLTPTARDLVTLAASLLERLGSHTGASPPAAPDPAPATAVSR